jgi:dipeptidyl aminopeptidase/acylaminoacyl peptidase
MAGIDHLIKTERIDPNRLGISGWSYGGYMAEWAITQTHRFKASVSGAGMANLASEFGTEDGPAYDHWFWGSPYENLDLFIKHSPIAYLKNVTTPTLIIQAIPGTVPGASLFSRPLRTGAVSAGTARFPGAEP